MSQSKFQAPRRRILRVVIPSEARDRAIGRASHNDREILRSEPDWRICAAQDDEAKVTQCGHRRCAVILVSDLPGDDAPRITFAPSLQPQTRIPSRCHVVAHAGVRPRRVVRLHPNTNRFVVDGRQGRYHTLTIHHSRFPR
jgi:hypothetical protein